MTAIYLMEALSEIDAVLIENAIAQPKIKRHPVGRILLIAAVIAALAASAFAVSETVSWFTAYFQKSSGELTQEQVDYIEDNTVNQHQYQICNGYTLALDSTFSDGTIGYVKLTLTGQKNAELDADNYGFQYIKCISPEESGGSEATSFSIGSYRRSEKNAVDIIITVKGKIADRASWKLSVGNLFGSYFEADQYREEFLANGIWQFDIIFSNDGNSELEVLGQPICIVLESGVDRPVYMDVLITSIKLRAMSAVIAYTNLDSPHAGVYFDGFYVVMKDGTKVELRYGSGGSKGQFVFSFTEPLILTDVSYLLLPDGRKLFIT